MFVKKKKISNSISLNDVSKIPKIIEYKNKYLVTAEAIKIALGQDNYHHVRNCMTRFRVTIKNKKLVDLESIKKLLLVKGVVWNNDELQIIIGGEVYKVVDEFKKLKNKQAINNEIAQEINQKPKLTKRILQALTGIMTPIIPVVMAVGILSALFTVLSQTGILKTSVTIDDKVYSIDMNNLYLFDLWTAMFFVLSKLALNVLGVFFIYNAAKYFKGNVIFALMVGLTLVARGMFAPAISIIPDVSIADAGFGDWISDHITGKTGWLLFKIGTFPIIVGGYEGSIIPFIIGGIVVTYIDRWIKKWMPTSVDIIFRPALVFLLTMLSLWFFLAPLFGILEFGLKWLVLTIGSIPYGFGIMIFAFFWQMLVVTGVHIPIALAVSLPIIQGGTSAIYMGIYVATFAQVASVWAVALRTRNANLKQVAWASSIAGVFGITEPIIYGVNLPKVKPFLFACIGAGFGGLLSGIFGLAAHSNGLMGIFGLIGVGGTTSAILLTLLAWSVAMIVAFTLTIFFYQERISEQKLFNKAISKLAKVIFNNPNKTEKLQLKSQYDDYLKKLNKKDFKKLELYYGQLSKYETKLAKINNIEAKKRELMFNQLKKMQQKLIKNQKPNVLIKFKQLNEKYRNYHLDDQKLLIEKAMNDYINSNEKIITDINDDHNYYLQELIAMTDIVVKKYDIKNKIKNENIDQIKNIFFNAINSVGIGFGKIEEKGVK